MKQSKEEIESIKELINLGNSHKEIAEFINEDFNTNRTVVAISKKCTSEGWSYNRSITTIKFKKMLYNINSDIKVIGEYVNKNTKIKVQCLIDNHIWRPFANRLLNGHGCPICSGNILKTNKIFVKEMYGINKNILILGNYINNSTNIKVMCLIDGYTWEASPNNLLKRKGCPNCVISNERDTKTYLLYFPELNLYKIGISSNIPRRQKDLGIKSELIFYINSKTRYDSKKLEQQWLTNISHLKTNTGKLTSGNTETFKY